MPSNKNKRSIFPLSNRLRNLLIRTPIILFIAVALIERLGCTSQFQQGDQQQYHQKTFTVLRVVDGDTIIINAPDHQNNQDTTRIRLWGVDTPETVHPRLPVMHFGPEASSFTKQLVEGKQVTIVLEPHQNTRCNYGRLLAYVYLPDNQMLNELLITQGYAYAEERFEHVLLQRFLQLQKQAQNQQLGLWQNAQPSDWPQWYQQRHAQ